MDAHIFEWLATGLATLCLFIIGLLVSAYRNEKERQEAQVKQLCERLDTTENRLGFIENVIAQLPGIDSAIKMHLITKGD